MADFLFPLFWFSCGVVTAVVLYMSSDQEHELIEFFFAVLGGPVFLFLMALGWLCSHSIRGRRWKRPLTNEGRKARREIGLE